MRQRRIGGIKRKKKFDRMLEQHTGGRKLKSLSWPMETIIMFDFYRFFKARGSIKYAKTMMSRDWGPYFDEAIVTYKDFVIAVRREPFDNDTFATIYNRSEARIKSLWNEVHGWILENNIFRGEQFTFPDFHKPKISRAVFSESRARNVLEANTKLFFSNLDKLRSHKLRTSRGIILYGSPGNGKTSICRWISRNSPDITRIWVTGWEMRSSNISEMFEIARTFAPAIIFMEDIDTAGISRHITGRINPLLGKLLNEMDGIEKNDGIIVIATTNNIYALDEALANRPGRFDLKIRIGNPHPRTVKKIIGYEDKITLAEAYRRKEEKIYYEKILGRKYKSPAKRPPVNYIG